MKGMYLYLCKDLSLGLTLNVAGHQAFSKVSRVDQNYGFRIISSENVTLHTYVAQDDRNMFKPFLK